MSVSIDPTAIVSSAAELGEGVEIGPFCTVGPLVRLEAGVKLISHVSVQGRTSIGADTVVHPFVSLGQGPQDIRYRGEDTALQIGRGNILREGVTMNLGTPKGRGVTRIRNLTPRKKKKSPVVAGLCSGPPKASHMSRGGPPSPPDRRGPCWAAAPRPC